MRIAITVLPRHWSLSKDVARGVRQGRECGNGIPRLCSGVKLMAYGVMSNHFHVLVYIGHPERLDDAEIVHRIDPSGPLTDEKRTIEGAIVKC